MEESIIERKCIFSKFNKYFIFPFLMPIMKVIATYLIRDILSQHYEKNGQKALFFSAVFECLTLIGGGLSYFIYFFKNIKDRKKKNEEDNIKSSYPIELIYNDSQKLNIKIIIILLIIMSLISSSALFVHYFVIGGKDKIDNLFYEILFIFIFSKKILNIEIYIHQKISLILSFIGFILLIIPVITEIKKNEIHFIFIDFVNSAAYSLYIILIKYLTDKMYISQYTCLFFVSFLNFLFELIIIMIFSLINENNIIYLRYSFIFPQLNGKQLYLKFIPSFILLSICHIFTYLIINYISPIIYIITYIIYTFIIWILGSINLIPDNENFSDDYIKLILYILGYLLYIFACLIINEMIILNFWGLSENTKEFIVRREKQDKNLLNDINEDSNFGI